MKLVRVKVENFRSVEDSEEFSIEDLTCLVGKNESGKTAILQAIQAVNPYGKPATDFDVTQEYPRRFVARFDERHPDKNPLVVSTWWKLTDDSKKVLTDEFGEDAINGDEVCVTKHYNQRSKTWILPLDQPKAVRNIINHAHFNAVERNALGQVRTVEGLLVNLTQLSNKTPKHDALLAKIGSYRDQRLMPKAIDLLAPLMPKFFYTSHYDRMSGQISAEQLAADQANSKLAIDDKIFLDFLELAGTSLKELRDATRYEALKSKCEAAANDISEQVFRYWTQNDALDVQLDFSQGRKDDPPPFDSGTVVRARVWNSLHRASVPFSERSAGFIWFFHFWFNSLQCGRKPVTLSFFWMNQV